MEVKLEEKEMSENKKSNNFNTIILLTDFSEAAKNAIRFAVEAMGEQVKYVLINAYYARTSSATLLDINDILAKESIEGLIEEERWLKAIYPDLNLDLEYKSVFGTPIDAVKRMAKDKSNDLLVMGTTGASGIDAVLFGSVAESVIRTTVVPVLAVPSKSIYKGFNELVFATDGKSDYSDVSLSPIRKMQNQFNTNVNVFSVLNESVDLSSQKVDLENVHYSSVEDENIIESVQNFCEQARADVLAIMPQHTGFFERLFHQSVSKEIILAANMPILALEND